jgi:glycosyltransferase involved in cell wall biosynthesis
METTAHFKSVFLQPSETFIRLQIDSMSRFRHLAVCSERLDNPVSAGIESVMVPGVDDALVKLTGIMPATSAMLRRRGVVLVHAHFGRDGWAASHLAGRGRRLPLVVSFYGRDATAVPRMEKWRRRYRELFDRADLVLALSDHMKGLLASLGCPPDRTRVHSFGTDVARVAFQRRRIPAGGPVRLLFVGRFVPKKGVATAIRALALMPGCTLDLVGDGALKEEYSALASGLGVADRVDFRGWLDPEAARAAMESAHVLLVPSETAPDGDMEGTPTVIFEAMASGLPVAASIHAGIPEQLGGGACGRLFPEGDAEGLAKAVDSLVSSPGGYADVATSARTRAEQCYDSRLQGMKLEELYRSLIAGR